MCLHGKPSLAALCCQFSHSECYRMCKDLLNGASSANVGWLFPVWLRPAACSASYSHTSVIISWGIQANAYFVQRAGWCHTVCPFWGTKPPVRMADSNTLVQSSFSRAMPVAVSEPRLSESTIFQFATGEAAKASGRYLRLYHCTSHSVHLQRAPRRAVGPAGDMARPAG